MTQVPARALSMAASSEPMDPHPVCQDDVPCLRAKAC